MAPLNPDAAPRSLACRTLRLRAFRNFEATEYEFPSRGVAVIGDNGAGKTNLLESIYYLELFRSFRGAPDEQLVRFGAEAFHIRGRFSEADSGRELEVTAAFDIASRRKRVTVDGVEPERLGDALGSVGMVVFSPGDVELVSGPPSERRRFLDIVLSLNVRGYLEVLQRYRQILRNRNRLLRDGVGGAALEAWDPGLTEAGGLIMAERARWIAERGPSFRTFSAAIGGGAGGTIAYRPAVPLGGAGGSGDEAGAFAAELRRLRRRELERGMTLTGPHRDDFECVLPGGAEEAPGVDARQFGSGGQRRTSAVALRLAEAETVRESRGREPLILLDDIFAELDPGRSERLLELLGSEDRGQVILTAPKRSDLAIRGGGLAEWSIAGGRITT